MPLIQQTITIAAAAIIEDILVNNVLAIVPRNTVVDVALVAAATGLVASVNVGTRQVAPQIIPSEANRVPILPDDFTLRFGATSGERIIIRVSNPTAGGIRLNFALNLRYV